MQYFRTQLGIVVFVIVCLGAFAASAQGVFLVKGALQGSITNGTYHSPTRKFSCVMPTLGKQKVFIAERTVNPGVTSDVRFYSNESNGVVVVCTKIRADLPKDDRVLDREAPKLKALEGRIGNQSYDFEFVTTKLGKTIQVTMWKQKFDIIFPYGISMNAKARERNPETIGIDWFFVRDGYFYEVAMIQPAEKGVAHDVMRKRALVEFGKFVDGLRFK